MRILIGWVAFLGLAALSRWVVSPLIAASAQRDLDAVEPGVLSIAPILKSGFMAPFFETYVPIMLLGGAAIVTLQWLGGKIVPKGRR